MAAGARWLIAAVARVFKPGCKSDYCLILEGRQGARSRRPCAPSPLPWFTDELSEIGGKAALLCDEIDAYEVTPDGDPIALAAARTSKFWNRKIVMCSTPTMEGRSRIAAAFAESDQRHFHVPCPLCGHMQTLVWAGIRWGNVEGREIAPPIAPEDAHYQCAGCRELIPHHRKLEMLIWATIPGRTVKTTRRCSRDAGDRTRRGDRAFRHRVGGARDHGDGRRADLRKHRPPLHGGRGGRCS